MLTHSNFSYTFERKESTKLIRRPGDTSHQFSVNQIEGFIVRARGCSEV